MAETRDLKRWGAMQALELAIEAMWRPENDQRHGICSVTGRLARNISSDELHISHSTVGIEPGLLQVPSACPALSRPGCSVRSEKDEMPDLSISNLPAPKYYALPILPRRSVWTSLTKPRHDAFIQQGTKMLLGAGNRSAESLACRVTVAVTRAKTCI